MKIVTPYDKIPRPESLRDCAVLHLTDERWIHIVKEHPEVGPYKDRIQEVLGAPEYGKMSNRDSEVLLYYRFYNDIFRACCTNDKKHKNVMLNLFQHLIKSIHYETLKHVQGDKNRFVQQALQW